MKSSSEYFMLIINIVNAIGKFIFILSIAKLLEDFSKLCDYNCTYTHIILNENVYISLKCGALMSTQM